eukprot:COSAG01_NODE_9606_length_2393_cov_1.788579_1_plen_49_part_10
MPCSEITTRKGAVENGISSHEEAAAVAVAAMGGWRQQRTQLVGCVVSHE